jgi:hypothetical protein
LENEAWRERDDALEQVAVRQADADRVRRAVREPFDRQVCGVDRDALEDGPERAVDERDVDVVVAADGVPRGAARLGREEHEAGVVRQLAERSQRSACRSRAPCSMSTSGAGFAAA